MNVTQFSLIAFDKLYVFNKNTHQTHHFPANLLFLFAFLILPRITMHFGVLFKMEMKS